MKYLLLLLPLFIFACRNEKQTCGNTLIGTGPEMAWFKSIENPDAESHAHYIMTCDDGGLLQVGESGTLPKKTQIFVVKTDANGQVIWKQLIGNPTTNFGNAALETSDGYLIAGALNYNAALIKLDKQSGSIVWQKEYDNGGADAFEHLSMVDGKIAAVGFINAEDADNSFFTEGTGLLAILDSAGGQLNTYNLGGTIAHAYRIMTLNDSLIISGLTADAQDYKLLKMTPDGKIIWDKSFGGANSDHCFAMDINISGDIFLSGHSLSDTENWDSYTLKINSKGEEQWAKKKGNPRGFDAKYIHDEVWDIKATSDGGCIIVAGTGDEYGSYSSECEDTGAKSDQWEVYLIKYAATGAIEWEKTYKSDEGGDWAGEAITLVGNSAVIAVDNGHFGLLKTGGF